MSLDKLIDVNSLLAVLAPSRGPLVNSQEADRPLGEKRQVASRSNPLSSAEKKAAAEYYACPLNISRTKEYSRGDFRSPRNLSHHKMWAPGKRGNKEPSPAQRTSMTKASSLAEAQPISRCQRDGVLSFNKVPRGPQAAYRPRTC